jgi:hypothetical protein
MKPLSYEGNAMLDEELERYINQAVVDAAERASRDPLTGASIIDPVQGAAEGSVIWTPSVQALLAELARESVIRREDEWVEQTGVPPEEMRYGGAESAAYDRLVQVFTNAMRGAEEIRRERESRAPLISLIEWIKDNWCGFWPLCQWRARLLTTMADKEIKLQAFETVRTWSSLLITLSTGAIVFTATFRKEFVPAGEKLANVPVLLGSWVALGFAILFGVLVLSTVAATLNKGDVNQLDVYKFATRISALIQLVAFVVGIALVAVFAYQNLP